jgi:endonuclease/exonuclease/phosphatase family metal-dependent hydrolase
LKLRVATYNIHKGVARSLFGLRHTATIQELRSRLHDLNSDLVFLQEVQGQNDRHAQRFEAWPDEPQNVFLARSPQKRHAFETAYGKNATYLHGHHGNALLSRFPIANHQTRDVSDHALEKRGILHCEIKLTAKQTVHCFVVHFGLLARSRARQTDVLMNWIEKELPADAPLLIAGDFNDWRHQLSTRLYKRLNVTEVFDDCHWAGPLQRKTSDLLFKGLTRAGLPKVATGVRAFGYSFKGIRGARTFPAVLPWLQMDRIYQRGFKTESATVAKGTSWSRLSDHVPLVAELTLKG